jgi:phage-related protein
MKQYTDFYFNGEFSKVKNVFNANSDDGLYEESVLAERSIGLEMIKNQPKGYLLNLERTPFKFSLKIFSKDKWTREKIDDISSWLDVNYFKEFYFEDESERRFFVMPTGEVKFTHTGAGEGFLIVEMQSQSPFTFSPRYQTGDYDVSVNTDLGWPLEFNNSGHTELFPIVRITKVGDGTISIKNESNLGKIFEIRNLVDGEEIFIDNQMKEIKSILPKTYHYDDHNGIWLSLIKGNNQLRIFGTCFIKFEYRYRYSPTL